MNKLYIPALLILILVLIFHVVGMNMNLYLHFSWYDIMMHIATGAGIALSAVWFLETIQKGSVKKHLWLIILLTFIAGIAWEVLEVVYNIAGHHYGTTQYWVDTVKDLADDTLGAVAVYIITKKYF